MQTITQIKFVSASQVISDTYGKSPQNILPIEYYSKTEKQSQNQDPKQRGVQQQNKPKAELKAEKAELKKVLSLLHHARERIRRGWCQGATAMSAAGNKVFAWSNRAVKWDTVGSLQATEMSLVVQKTAFEYLVRAWLETSADIRSNTVNTWAIDSFMFWTDSKFTSLNQVLDIYGIAIQRIIEDIRNKDLRNTEKK